MADTLTEQLYGKGLVEGHRPPKRGPLIEHFGWTPYSTLNTRSEDWQERKRKWIKWCGIQSEEGRGDELTYNIPLLLSDGRTGNKIESQTSIFDPTLCELCYTWWCPPGGIVLDPFAGGSVRGMVAAVLGLRYFGIDLAAAQITANRAQYAAYTAYGGATHKPQWRCGDSFLEVEKAPPCDFIFSCPPYGDLEKYSDLPQDLSNMGHGAFTDRYADIIRKAGSRLKPDCFAAWVVGNYRDKGTGRMRDFVGDTVRAFEAAGLMFYNDIILVNSVGSGAMRANTSFLRGHRKVVKLHQNVLIFVKGSAKAAASKLTPPRGMEGISDGKDKNGDE